MFEKYSLKWTAIWLGIAWGLIGAVIFLSLVRVDLEVPGGGYSDKVGHVIAYATIMYWFGQIYADSKTRLVVAVALAALGFVLEHLQAYTGYRTYEYADMLANAIGVVLGWLAAPPRTPNLLLVVEKVSVTR